MDVDDNELDVDNATYIYIYSIYICIKNDLAYIIPVYQKLVYSTMKDTIVKLYNTP